MLHVLNQDPHRKVTALIITGDGGEWIGAGNNGFVNDKSSTAERWFSEEKYFWALHAEEAAIHSAYQGGFAEQMQGGHIYTTYFPCARCANHIARAGIKTVHAPRPDCRHHRWGPDWMAALQILKENDIRVFYP